MTSSFASSTVAQRVYIESFTIKVGIAGPSTVSTVCLDFRQLNLKLFTNNLNPTGCEVNHHRESLNLPI